MSVGRTVKAKAAHTLFLTAVLTTLGFVSVSCRAAVVSVSDGDTFEARALDREGRPMDLVMDVRLIGIDTPETHHPGQPKQCFGEDAAGRSRQLLGGKEVILVEDEERLDARGRWLWHVSVDGEWLSLMLVRDGFAIVDTYPPNLGLLDQLVAAQRQAKAERRGLWGGCFASPGSPLIISYIFSRQDEDGGEPASDEYVELTNISGRTLDMTGWALVSEKGAQRFRFPEGTIIQPQQTCRVYSHQVRHDSCTGGPFGGGWVWNDRGDYATLWDQSGKLVDEYAYGDCRPTLERVVPC